MKAIEYHSVDTPYENSEDISFLCCPACAGGTRAVSQIEVLPNQYYYCPECECEWGIPGPMRPGVRPSFGFFVFVVLWLSYIFGVAFVMVALCAALLVSFGWTMDSAITGGALLSIIPTMIAWTISGWLYNNILAPVGELAWRTVWGEPL